MKIQDQFRQHATPASVARSNPAILPVLAESPKTHPAEKVMYGIFALLVLYAAAKLLPSVFSYIVKHWGSWSIIFP